MILLLSGLLQIVASASGVLLEVCGPPTPTMQEKKAIIKPYSPLTGYSNEKCWWQSSWHLPEEIDE
jgi:hypothetical protein